LPLLSFKRFKASPAILYKEGDDALLIAVLAFND
jgi:hypothetical protein